jgi:hypothetical protein
MSIKSWWNGLFCARVYCAKAMTGIRGDTLVKQAKETRDILQRHGIEVLDPVLAEHVKKSKRRLHNSFSKLREYWDRDKELIREAHAIIDCTPQLNSEGVKHEIGYARFTLWKPTVRLYPHLGPSIAKIEDDYIASTLDEAADVINERWGNWYKRFKWRLVMLNRCLPKFVYYQIKELLH